MDSTKALTFQNGLHKLILQVFRKLQYIVDGNNGRIYIPKNDHGLMRVSEQELRQLFIELFLSDELFKSYRYSVETPTIGKYRFSSKGKRYIPMVVSDCSARRTYGRCANIDLSIFEGENRVAIIEFKANNPGSFEHAKDFVKLSSEPGNNLVRVFIEIYTQTDADTLRNIHEKLFTNKYGSIGQNTLFYGYSLNHQGDIANGLISCDADYTTGKLKIYNI